MFVLNMSPDVYGMPWIMYQAAIPTTKKWQKYTVCSKSILLHVLYFIV